MNQLCQNQPVPSQNILQKQSEKQTCPVKLNLSELHVPQEFPSAFPHTARVICRGMRCSIGKLYVYWLIPERNACWTQTLYQSLRIWREKADYLPEFLYRMYRWSTANCFPAHWCSVCLLTLVSRLHRLSDYAIVIFYLGQSLPQGTYSESLFVRGGR